MSIEEVPNGTTGNTEKRASCQPIEKPTHKHGLDVLCYSAWNEPDQEEKE